MARFRWAGNSSASGRLDPVSTTFETREFQFQNGMRFCRAITKFFELCRCPPPRPSSFAPTSYGITAFDPADCVGSHQRLSLRFRSPPSCFPLHHKPANRLWGYRSPCAPKPSGDRPDQHARLDKAVRQARAHVSGTGPKAMDRLATPTAVPPFIFLLRGLWTGKQIPC
jgi:hypothetical protein